MLTTRILLTASLVLAGTHMAAAQRNWRDRTGLQLYTVRDDCARDFPGTLKAVAAMGYAGVEFAGYYGRAAQELRAMLDEDHLKCFGTHLQLGDLMGDNFDKTIAYNKVLGNRLLTIASLSGERTGTHTSLLETARLLDDLAGKVEAQGMMLAYHDHPGDFRTIDGELEWLTLFRNTRRLKIQFDIGNALEGGQQAAALLGQFQGRFISAHVKDYSAKDNAHTLLGQGDEDWNQLIPVLKGRYGPRWFIIEQETYPFPPLECAKQCLLNFQNLMK